MDIYYVDGQYVPADQAVIPVNDLALLRGYGVFDFLRTHDGSPFLLQEHLSRLKDSAKKIGLNFPWTRKELTGIVNHTIQQNKYGNATIRIIVTGGPSRDFITPDGKPRLLVIVSPASALPEFWYTEGIKVITIAMERTIPGAKSINYLDATMALTKAREQGAVEAMYMDTAGFIKEGTTSNLFAFYQDCLVTPGKNILSGITRKVILKIAKPLFEIKIREIRQDSLYAADEIFISGSNKGIVPVVQVDDMVIGSGRPGQRTGILMQHLKDYIRAATPFRQR
jgi:branched-chain amino acid aminotransferase